MVSQNEKARKKRVKEKVAEAEERKVIVQNGGNPYEVFRRRREDERAARERQKLVDTQTSAEKRIAEKMVSSPSACVANCQPFLLQGCGKIAAPILGIEVGRLR